MNKTTLFIKNSLLANCFETVKDIHYLYSYISTFSSPQLENHLTDKDECYNPFDYRVVAKPNT